CSRCPSGPRIRSSRRFPSTHAIDGVPNEMPVLLQAAVHVPEPPEIVFPWSSTIPFQSPTATVAVPPAVDPVPPLMTFPSMARAPVMFGGFVLIAMLIPSDPTPADPVWRPAPPEIVLPTMCAPPDGGSGTTSVPSAAGSVGVVLDPTSGGAHIVG